MLQLLQPIWLWACAGILVPILIHLWHVKQGKTLKIGSLVFLQESSKQQSTSFKISEWLLLILRCLLIILLSLILAKPQFKLTEKVKDKNGYIVVDSKNMAQAYQQYKSTIDSLLQHNYELYYFENGLIKTSLENTLHQQKDTSLIAASYWQLAHYLAKTIKSSKPIYLFTNNLLANFNGNKPVISNNLKWFTYSLNSVPTTLLTNAYKTIDDSLKITTINSDTSSTIYTSSTVAFKQGQQGNYRISNQYVRDNQTDILIDTSTLRISIYTDKYFEDTKYVKAAINTIQQFTKRQIITTIINDRNKLLLNTDWVFWLSDLPINRTVKKTKFIKYKTGQNIDSMSWLQNKNIGINKYIFDSSSDIPVWQNSFGNNILSIDDKDANTFNLSTHFNPNWNNLVWDEQFPKLILSILSADKENEWHDLRTIDKAQLSNYLLTYQSHTEIETEYKLKDVSNIIWLMAVMLFTIERWLSFKTKKLVLND